MWKWIITWLIRMATSADRKEREARRNPNGTPTPPPPGEDESTGQPADPPEEPSPDDPDTLPTPTPGQPPLSYEFSSYQLRLHELHNHERQARRTPRLLLDIDLCQAAMDHSNYQAAIRKMTHSRSDGRSLFDDIAGSNVTAAGENVAVGQTTPEEVTQAWMRSTGHRRNIIRSGYTHVGFGHAMSGGRIYWTTIFATRNVNLEGVFIPRDLVVIQLAGPCN